MDIIFGMFFFTLSNVKVNFNNCKLKWRLYITMKALLTTRRVKPVGKKEFTIAALDPEDETFIVYVAFIISSSLDLVHLFD